MSRRKGCCILAVFSFFGGMQRHVTSTYLRNTAKLKYGTKTSSFSTPILGGFSCRILVVFLERKCLVHSDLIYLRIKHILRKLSIGSGSNLFSLQSLNQKYVFDLPSCLSRRGLCAEFTRACKIRHPKYGALPRLDITSLRKTSCRGFRCHSLISLMSKY
jgi:hypothetical protein